MLHVVAEHGHVVLAATRVMSTVEYVNQLISNGLKSVQETLVNTAL
jgi:hypothetical protein